MISELARVFSSNGVLMPAYEPVPVYGKRAADIQDAEAFAPVFEQAAAKLELSRRAREFASGREHVLTAGEAGAGDAGGDVPAASASGATLSDAERETVEKLSKRDREVRAHEQAHIASAGGYAKGGAKYEYQAGPDGKSYAVGGSVQIDTSPVPGNPQATLQKAAIIRQAALAVAEPSGADRAVAAAASRLAVEARKELAAVQEPSGGVSGMPARSGPLQAYAGAAGGIGGRLNISA